MTAELSEGELHSIFDSEIRPSYEHQLGSPASRPTFVLLGGQPGAGKTESVAPARHEVPNAVEVVGDDLRLFHPQYAELTRTDPLQMPVAAHGRRASHGFFETAL